MLSKLVRNLFGSRNQRTLNQYQSKVAQINALAESYESLSDEALKGKTHEFKARLEKGETLDSLMVEAFATVRETGRRVLNMRHFDVQLIGGMSLHEGKIAEMSTGEGKTLMATLPAYLNALSGRPVHIVTVNPYLVRRDAEWMAPLYELLGLTVGVVVPDMPLDEKRASYHADVIYATNNELGFDYLRDRMAYSVNERVQTELAFAIVDEVDSILIDEARTPLIISGQAQDSSELYLTINRLIPLLKRQEQEGAEGDFTVDEKTKQIHLTEAGHDHVEQLLSQNGLLPEGDSLYDPKHLMLFHHVNAAIRAHAIFRRDVEYLLAGGEVVIVDEHTGRAMPGRRWSDGLHQAIEAKEGVPIHPENQTLASITFQNFFRLYGKLAGMTGTADTEAYEFQQIYGLEVVVIPTNRPCQRKDMADMVYLTVAEKFEAIVTDIKTCYEKGQPVLVGTISIENSEYLSQRLTKEKVPHNVLNAKFHEQEAQIIADAGKIQAVTIATNMAGRGTDIVLGGSLSKALDELPEGAPEADREAVKQQWQADHDKVIELGGLHILGTERHESRRIDNQLRGRSGRQGDPGSSQFFLSLEDPLMRLFASDRVKNMMRTLGVKDGEAITHSIVSRSIENAQRKVEGHNFDIRKNLLQFDDVANDQRKVIYSERDMLVKTDDLTDKIQEMLSSTTEDLVYQYMPEGTLEQQWQVPALENRLKEELGLDVPVSHWLEENKELDIAGVANKVLEQAQSVYREKCDTFGEKMVNTVQKSILLHHLDLAWREHLSAMDYLRQSIHLRGYAQKDPRQEYKREAFELFSQMLANVRLMVVGTLLKAQLQAQPDEAISHEEEALLENNRVFASGESVRAKHDSLDSLIAPKATDAFAANSADDSAGDKVGRNDICPCGSQKKYKHCHGKI